MAYESKHYFGGFRPLYLFEEFGDCSNYFIETQAIIDEPYYTPDPLWETQLDTTLSAFNGRADIASRDFRLLKQEPTPEPPGRLRLREVWGYVPEETHSEPGIASFSFPGMVDGITQNLNIVGARFVGKRVKVTLSGATILTPGSMIRFYRQRNSYEPPSWQPSTSKTIPWYSNEVVVLESSGNTVTVDFPVISAQVDNKTVTYSRAFKPETAVNLLASVSSSYLEPGRSIGGLKGRDPFSSTAPCVNNHSYFLAFDSIANQLTPTFKTIGSDGGITNMLGVDSSPTVLEYQRMISRGQMITPNPPKLERLYGPIWRQTIAAVPAQ
ncbi:hypothetical protein [Cerasicoccus frondis]|uniref:hypothetical protein n=1 Tax=Cerasicoccus frondis TaxID=490090 RepID=UPI002852BCA3|nr:hypothetical protein [Cerasicoccus frondis]